MSEQRRWRRSQPPEVAGQSSRRKSRGSGAFGRYPRTPARLISHRASSITLLAGFARRVNGDCARFAASKSTVYRHLSALARHGFVRRDVSTGRYAIGVKLMVLGETSRGNFEIVTVARDVLLKLRNTTGQAISLCTLLDDDLVVLDLIHGRSVVEFATRPGTRLALHASAHGKIWLAFGPEGLLKKVLGAPRPAWTSHTLTDAKTIAAEVQVVANAAGLLRRTRPSWASIRSPPPCSTIAVYLSVR